MRDMPEPKQWNGGPDDTSVYFERLGARREPLAKCYICGEDKPDGPDFGDRTCGKPECRDAAVRR
jgi:hypothetical protein